MLYGEQCFAHSTVAEGEHVICVVDNPELVASRHSSGLGNQDQSPLLLPYGAVELAQVEVAVAQIAQGGALGDTLFERPSHVDRLLELACRQEVAAHEKVRLAQAA